MSVARRLRLGRIRISAGGGPAERAVGESVHIPIDVAGVRGGPFPAEARCRLRSGVRSRETTNSVILHRGRGGVQIQLREAPRGLFQIEFLSFTVSDPFGLSRLVVTGTPVHRRAYPLLRVRAERAPAREVELHLDAGPRIPRFDLSAERNDELIEARPYHPGDDIRRIHWTMYAHTGRLFVRVGEEVAPPAVVARITIDARGLTTPAQLDRLFGRALGLSDRIAIAQHGEPEPELEWMLIDTRGRRTVLGGTNRAERVLAAADPEAGLLDHAEYLLGGAARNTGGSVGESTPARSGVIITTGRSPSAPAGADRNAVILLYGGTHRIGSLDT